MSSRTSNYIDGPSLALNNAWDAGGGAATEWVKLCIATPSFHWNSITCRAMIMPALVAPVILGLPFLEINHLVINAAGQALCDTRSSLDILTPPFRPNSPPLPVSDRRTFNQELTFLRDEELTAQKCDVLHELCLEHPPVAPGPSPPLPIAAVRAHVESLVVAETLCAQLIDEDRRMHKHFQDCFPSVLPPVTDLPDDVFHRFHLKDATMSIQHRQYESPKKCREVWKHLLQEHINMGRLQPSSSSYSSPCFLIPKSNPTADPQWVNDYRLLNMNTIPDMHPLPSISEILSNCGHGHIFR